MTDIAARRVTVVEVTTPTPSPFAQSLLFGYTAQFLYDGDAPLAERRAAALTLDPRCWPSCWPRPRRWPTCSTQRRSRPWRPR